jgi:hypothetical protein
MRMRMRMIIICAQITNVKGKENVTERCVALAEIRSGERR